MSVEKPPNLLKTIVVTERTLMTAGISKMHPRIRAAMTLPLLAPNDPQFHQILKEITEGIRYVFQTVNRYTFAINGPITMAFETALSNLIDTEQKVMAVIHGVRGERIAKTAIGMGFTLLRFKTGNPGDLVEKNSIKNALQTHKPKMLVLCHGDDTVGTLQPLRGIGALCHENDCLFVVDASSTVACAPLSADQMEIDVLIASTEYALGGPPGLSLITFSYRAIDMIRKKKEKTVCYSMNFELLIQMWGLSDEGNTSRYAHHYTPPVVLLYALRESLSIVVEEGLDRVIARHMKMSYTAQLDINKIGLKFLVSEEKNRLSGVLVILVPDSVKREAIIDYMLKYYDIVISDGIPPIDKVWRIGILGPNANRQSVKILSSVLRDAIQKAKSSSSPKSTLSSPSTIDGT